jgi:hypothetical protein
MEKLFVFCVSRNPMVFALLMYECAFVVRLLAKENWNMKILIFIEISPSLNMLLIQGSFLVKYILFNQQPNCHGRQCGRNGPLWHLTITTWDNFIPFNIQQHHTYTKRENVIHSIMEYLRQLTFNQHLYRNNIYSPEEKNCRYYSPTRWTFSENW